MANQPSARTYDAGVYQWEITDPARGGLGGVMNAPLLSLTNRTDWLYDNKLSLAGGTMTGPISFGGSGLQVGTGVQAGLYGDGTNISLRGLNVAGSTIFLQAYNGSTTYATIAAVGAAFNVPLSATSVTAGGFSTSGATATGSLSVTGNTSMGSAATGGSPLQVLGSNNAGLEFGFNSNNTAFVDFHTSAALQDYDVRIQATGNPGSVGGGALSFLAAGGFFFNSKLTVQYGGGGYVDIVSSGNASPGYVEFLDSTGTRRGFVGYGDGQNNIALSGDNGWGVDLQGTVFATTQSAGDNSTKLATTQYADRAISTAISNLINGAPAALDTLKELADAIGDDANYHTTIVNALATKAALSGATFTGGVNLNYNQGLGANGSNDYDSGGMLTLSNTALGGDQRTIAFGTSPGGNGYVRSPHQGVDIVSGATLVATFGAGGASFSARPTWAGYTPWDSNNLSPVTTTTSFGGDVSGTYSGITLNTVNGSVGTYGVARYTFDGKGRMTGVSSASASDVTNVLGYTPVRQGGGANQGTNTIYIGWDGSNLRAQVDSFDQGPIAFQSWAYPRSGGAITGSVSVSGSVTVNQGGEGQVALQPGSGSAPGYCGFYTSDGTRRGYIGFSDGGTNINITGDNGWGVNFPNSPQLPNLSYGDNSKNGVNSAFVQAALSGLISSNVSTSFSGNGYAKLFGFIVQWGYVAGPFNESSQAVTLPVSFPNGCFASFGSALNVSPDYKADLFIQTQALGNSTIYFYVDSSSTSDNITGFYWMAIGY